MNVAARVADLKQQFERLFPGKWFLDKERSRCISTGITTIDTGITRGIMRQRITEWSGPVSSGKSAVLRATVKHWCTQGLKVAYIDSEGLLYAADWSFPGTFWIVRPQNQSKPATITPGGQENSRVVPLASKKVICQQEAIWSADQFIRSNAFDVVILDMGSGKPEGSAKSTSYIPGTQRLYARLQRALDKSKAACIVVYNTTNASITATISTKASSDTRNIQWNCHARFNFNHSTINCIEGLNGVALLAPTVKFSAWRDGISQEMEVRLATSVPNRMLTNSRVPDRRTSKG